MKTSTVRSLSFSHLSLISVNTHVTSSLSVTIAVTSNIVKTGSTPSPDAPDFSLVQTVSNGKPSTARVTSFLTKMKAFVIGPKTSMKSVMVLPQSQQVPQHLSPASLIVLFDAWKKAENFSNVWKPASRVTEQTCYVFTNWFIILTFLSFNFELSCYLKTEINLVLA